MQTIAVNRGKRAAARDGFTHIFRPASVLSVPALLLMSLQSGRACDVADKSKVDRAALAGMVRGNVCGVSGTSSPQGTVFHSMITPSRGFRVMEAPIIAGRMGCRIDRHSPLNAGASAMAFYLQGVFGTLYAYAEIFSLEIAESVDVGCGSAEL